MIKEQFFYRKFNSTKFIKSRTGNFSIDPHFIIIKQESLENCNRCFCPLHRCWEKTESINRHNVIISCGLKIKGIPELLPEIAAKKENAFQYVKKTESFWNEVIIKGRKYTDTQFKILQNPEVKTQPEKIPSFSELDFDDDCVSLYFAGIRILYNDSDWSFSIENIYLDKEKILSEDFNYINKVPVIRSYARYNLKTGKSKIISSQDNPVVIPKWLNKTVYSEFTSLLYKWAGKKITINTTLDGQKFLKAATDFPYEPNLSILAGVYKDYFTEKINFSTFHKNPDAFNKVCARLKIKPFKTLRKVFTKDPLAPIRLKLAKECGFKDENIINSILLSEEGRIFMRHYMNQHTNLIFFCNKFLKQRSELALWNVMKKMSTQEYLYDALSMFYGYFDYIPEEVKKEIYINGLTDYYHDVLSKIVTQIKNKNVDFNYSESQKKLEDEISGYSFKLPENSDKLIEIGTTLHNCVASYKSNVLEGRCIIVYAVKDAKIKLCIEIRRDTIHQQRADCNKYPEGDDLKVMEEYQKRHKLNFYGNSF